MESISYSEQMQIFNSVEFGDIRLVMLNNEPWFVGKDIAKALGYERATKAIQSHVDYEDKDAIPIRDSIGRMQKTPIINESGLYSLIISSKLETAKRFKHWITSEVIPSIRKHGAYMTPETLHKALSDPDNLIQLLQTLKSEQARNKELQTVNAALTEQAHEWNDKAILNALIRAYSLKVYNGIFGNGWNELYKNLQYHEHINLKIRRGHSKDKNKGLIEFIRPDEFCKAVKIAVAMCEKAGIDTYKVINEVNMKNIENDKGDDLK